VFPKPLCPLGGADLQSSALSQAPSEAAGPQAVVSHGVPVYSQAYSSVKLYLVTVAHVNERFAHSRVQQCSGWD